MQNSKLCERIYMEESISQKPAKILVVDSEESSRGLLKRRLSIFGHEVYLAADENEAISQLKKEPIDVVLLNMFINKNNSYDFLVQLKEDADYNSIPTIMISSDGDTDLVVRCIEAGAEDYLVKPLNQTLLRARLANCIMRKEAHDKELAYLAKIKQSQNQIMAQEKMASLGELMSSISQELKNPLNFIINFAEVCADVCNELLDGIQTSKIPMESSAQSLFNEKLSKFLSNSQKIREYGHNADKIIRFMLDQSTTSVGKRYPGNINKIIDQTITMLISHYKGNGITSLPRIETQLDNSIPHVLISIQSFSKALYNILDNAFYSVIEKYEDISQASVRVKTENTSDAVKVSIYDNGTGIKADILDRIFTPFFTTKPEGTGPGLGLSAAKEVVEEHQGRIDVNTEEGQYAEFTITIEKPKE